MAHLHINDHGMFADISWCLESVIAIYKYPGNGQECPAKAIELGELTMVTVEPTSKRGKCSRVSYRCANHLILKVRLSEEEALNTCVNYHVCRGRMADYLALWYSSSQYQTVLYPLPTKAQRRPCDAHMPR